MTKAIKYKMTDKERILLYLLRWLGRPDFRSDKHDANIPWVDWRKAQKGDLVICSTSGIHPWTVGYIVNVLSSSSCLIREIGSDRLCTVSNELFYPIRGSEGDPQFLEGADYDFYRKVIKAFTRGDEFRYRFAGVEIENRKAVIWIRERYGGMSHRRTGPFSVEMKWNPKTTIKCILETMRAGGYGTRKFEDEEKTEEGNNELER